MNFKPLNIDLKAKNKLCEKLDPTIIKQKPQGKNKTDYIAGNTCIDILNSIFGYMWDFDILREWVEPGVPQFIEDNNYNTAPDNVATINSKGVRGMLVETLPTVWCKVKLTVYLENEKTGEIFPISKTAFGSQAITGGQTQQSNTGYKGAQTDALKKAATLFGVALELYRDEKEKIYFDKICKQDQPIIFTKEVKEQYKEELDRIEKASLNYKEPKQAIAYFVNEITKGYTNDIYKMPLEYLDDLLGILKA